MAIPEGILADGADEPLPPTAREELRRFADDLAANRVEGWRRLLPTFADVSIDGNRAEADLRMLINGKPVSLTTELITDRLQGRAP